MKKTPRITQAKHPAHNRKFKALDSTTKEINTRILTYGIYSSRLKKTPNQSTPYEWNYKFGGSAITEQLDIYGEQDV